MSLYKENLVSTLQMMKKIAPEEMTALVRRYHILRAIRLLEPVGRRTISLSLDFSERTVRNETEKLHMQQLIAVSREGMNVTEEGEKILADMEPFIKYIDGIAAFEKNLTKSLNITEAYIAEECCKNIQKELGRIAAEVVLRNINKESKIALTGGSTLANMVEAMPFSNSKKAKIVIPARGSIGGILEQQADTLAAGLAEKLGAKYRLLQLPDHMSKKAFDEMKQQPLIQQTINEIRQTDVLILGVGNALEMAKKRQVVSEVYEFLLKKGAVAEMLGYYLDSEGTIVYTSYSIGLRLEELNRMKKIIIVAAGKNKAESLIAVCKRMPQAILITDTATAKEIIKIAEKNNV
ncbi:sugar-binding domain-containing protein [Lachnospiraceae bacterium 46-61]